MDADAMTQRLLRMGLGDAEWHIPRPWRKLL